jgi:hypothetical protein
MKLQYEALRPAPPDDGVWECPEKDCPETSDSSLGLEQHLQANHVPEKMGLFEQEHHFSAVTDGQAKKKLAKRHFPDFFEDDESTRGLDRVGKLIKIASLPPDLRALYKDPEDRTDAEKARLEKKGIPADRVLSEFGGASQSVLSLHDELQSVDGVDASERVLETVAELDKGQGSMQLGDRISAVRDDVIDQVGASESAAETQQVVSDTIQKHKETLIEQTDGISDTLTSKLGFKLSNNKYSVYHARAKERAKAQYHSEVVRDVYEEWLENEAEENGW